MKFTIHDEEHSGGVVVEAETAEAALNDYVFKKYPDINDADIEIEIIADDGKIYTGWATIETVREIDTFVRLTHKP